MFFSNVFRIYTDEMPHFNLPSVSVNSRAINRKMFLQLSEPAMVLFTRKNLPECILSQEDRTESLVTNVQEKSTQCCRLHKFSTRLYGTLYKRVSHPVFILFLYSS